MPTTRIAPRRSARWCALAGPLAVLAVAFALVAASAAPALAVDPPQTPAPIISEGFETAYPGYLDVSMYQISGDPPTSAWWGRITGSKHAGSYGLWVAGVGGSWPSDYPIRTRGTATFDVPQLADYYSSALDFHYTMPTVGVSDVLITRWAPDAYSAAPDFDVKYEPVSSGWALGSYDLASVGNQVNLSRSTGDVQFFFFDFAEPSGVTPTQGRGPTIDDVTIAGYKYGPVRNLVAQQLGESAIRLTWDPPYSATDTTTADARSHAYRVWRGPGTSPAAGTWTELTGARIATTEFTDSTATLGETYTYLVQAWDPASGTGYGEPNTVSQDFFGLIRLEKTPDATVVLAGTEVEYTYEVFNTGSADLESISVEDDLLGTVGSHATLSGGQSWSVTATSVLTTTTSNVGTVTADDAASGTPVSDSDTATVTVISPAVSVEASVDIPTAVVGEPLTYTYDVTNTGDVELVDLDVDDGALGLIGSIPSLAPGASESLEATGAASVTRTHDVTVSGSDALLASTVEGADSFGVTVYDPAVTITKTPSAAVVTPPNTDVTYTYRVENTGDVALSGLSVTDDLLGAVGSIASLAPGAWTELTDSDTLTQDTTNVGSVTGTYGTFGTSFYGSVTDTDTAFVDVIAPAILLTKTADASVVLPGTDVTYTYVARNTGDYALSSVQVTDDRLGTIASGQSLAMGAELTYERTVAATWTGPVTNVGEARGFAAGWVSDTDSATVTVVDPAVALDASVDSADAVSGQPLTFSYEVTNTGDVGLVGLSVDDDVLGHIGDVASLAPGAATTLQTTVPATSTVTHTATVTGTDSLIATPVEATDPVGVTVWDPAVQITKTADASPVPPGTLVTYTYRVENTGDVALSGLSVTDDLLGAVDSIASLAPGAWTELTDSDTLAADTTNVGSVTGTYGTFGTPFYGQVGDTGSESVDVIAPAIQLTKTADASVVLPNTLVTYTYRVENTGEAGLSDLEITDDRLGAVDTVASLAPGASTTRQDQETIGSDTTASGRVSATDDVFSLTWTDADSETVRVAHPGLTISLAASPKTAAAGSMITLEATVSNTGDVRLSSVRVRDDDGHLDRTVSLSAGASTKVAWTETAPAGPASSVSRTVRADSTYTDDAGGTKTLSDSADASYAVTAPELPEGTERLAGTDRMDTAVQASQTAFEDPLTGERAVVIASAWGWADALPASALAGSVGGPLLLVNPESVSPGVLAEIGRLGAAKAYIVGGTGVVAPSVGSQLSGAGLAVERVAGATRYGTAQAVAAKVVEKEGRGGTVFVATGLNFPDALAASSLAAAMKGPIVLALPSVLPADAQAALRTVAPDEIVVCGGTGVVSAGIEQQLRGYAPSVIRKAGANRYDTAKALVEWGQSELVPGGPGGVLVATGTNYPDALAGGVLAGIGHSDPSVGYGEWLPLMLTDPAVLSPQVESYIQANPSIGFAGILGGAGAVSPAVEAKLAQLVQ